MASPSPEAFWALLGESKLVDPARLDSLRRQFEGIPIPPKADAKTITDLLVGWLEKQQVVTRWQAEQLLLGKKGPFFLGDYRLLERLPTGRGGVVFRARHEPAEGQSRLVSLAVLDAKLCQQPAVGTDLKQRIKLTREAADGTLIGSLETKTKVALAYVDVVLLHPFDVADALKAFACCLPVLWDGCSEANGHAQHCFFAKYFGAQ